MHPTTCTRAQGEIGGDASHATRLLHPSLMQSMSTSSGWLHSPATLWWHVVRPKGDRYENSCSPASPTVLQHPATEFGWYSTCSHAYQKRKLKITALFLDLKYPCNKHMPGLIFCLKPRHLSQGTPGIAEVPHKTKAPLPLTHTVHRGSCQVAEGLRHRHTKQHMHA